VGDEEWRAVLTELGFGQLIAPGGPERELPVVVPTHFVFDGRDTLGLHFARPNPVWQALDERPRAILTVVADYVYVPGAPNASPGTDPALGVPTSYYATVQAQCDVEVVDDPVAKADLLNRQLARFEPPGSGRRAVGADDPGDRRQLAGIRGVRLTITGVRAKFKYGGNKGAAHRRDLADALRSRNGPMDAAARARLLGRLPDPADRIDPD